MLPFNQFTEMAEHAFVGARVRVEGFEPGGPDLGSYEFEGTVLRVHEEHEDVGTGESGPLVQSSACLVVLCDDGVERNADIPALEEGEAQNPYETLTVLDGQLPTDAIYTVAAYGVQREYGGPEEGGWWYDVPTYDSTTVAGLDLATAVARCKLLNAAAQVVAKREGLIGRHSVPRRRGPLGGADLVYYVEVEERSHELKEVPHYC